MEQRLPSATDHSQRKEKTMSCQGMTREGKGSTHGQRVYICKHCGAGGCENDD